MLRFGFHSENVRKDLSTIDKGKSSLTDIYSSEITVDFISFAIKMFVFNFYVYSLNVFFIVNVLLS